MSGYFIEICRENGALSVHESIRYKKGEGIVGLRLELRVSKDLAKSSKIIIYMFSAQSTRKIISQSRDLPKLLHILRKESVTRF